MIARRALLGAAMALPAASCARRPPRPTIRLAAGEPEGFYFAFAHLLAGISTDLEIGIIATTGSRTNLAILADGDADIAMSLADSLPAAPRDAAAIARIYEDYLQLFVRRDSPVRTIADLRGRRISLGALGSGGEFTGDRLMRASGLDPGADLDVIALPLPAAIAALENAEIDALLWVGGVPTPLLDSPARMRLLDIGSAAAPLRELFHFPYHRIRIPAGVYAETPAVDTVGTSNILLTTTAVPDSVIATVTRTLLDNADRLMPYRSAGSQYLDERSMISTADLPLHPAAARVYRERHR
ncbi:TAXI family TRAP transporter solute-binding subunit [Nocardia sp. BMG51109]|uniref:TAXI family TRAP transporter solute-binding subunit n=1 Tax=Nocardia sp. BMG51109 TaxID=1056816 RepID=UPI000465BA3F|nr:TAXI family TRAP transporter solute-binding subunit [Nocardia sp. BMG51109]